MTNGGGADCLMGHRSVSMHGMPTNGPTLIFWSGDLSDGEETKIPQNEPGLISRAGHNTTSC